ncbi:MAG: hypothetical protein JWO17_1323 [Actinomycetia bacterium]|nr:hypothetical protein [Actinomycetes bacterium]
MLADGLDYVIGVDTHRDEHVLAVVAASTGALIAQRSVPTNAQGMPRPSASQSDTRQAHVSGRSNACHHFGEAAREMK